jgi:arylsulfatase
MEYERWKFDHAFLLVPALPAQALAAQRLSSFKEFPPRQKPASFNLNDVMKKMSEPQAGGNN